MGQQKIWRLPLLAAAVTIILAANMYAAEVTPRMSTIKADSTESYRYTQGTGTNFSVQRVGNGDEVYFIQGGWSSDSAAVRAKAKEDTAPNTVLPVKSGTIQEKLTLNINSNMCGVIIEPVEGDRYVVECVGMKYPEQFTLDVTQTAGKLDISINGELVRDTYISTVSTNLVNVLRIGLPQHKVKEIVIQDQTAFYKINNLDVPVTASTVSGGIRLLGSSFSAPVQMSATSGDLFVESTGQVTGAVNLGVVSGDIYLQGTQVSGEISLSATSGDVVVQAQYLEAAKLTATSGDINAEVGTIGRNVSAAVTSGDILFRLTRQPENLTLQLHTGSSSDATLPSGWRNGTKVGSGDAILQLKCTSGDLIFEIQ